MRDKVLLTHKFVELIPRELEANTIYVSVAYATAIHKCCCGCGARRQDIEDSARPRHRGQSEALDWRTLCACLGMLAPWFRSVNVLRLVLFWSANRSPNSVAVFTSLGPRVTNGCIASAIRGAMVCGIVPVGHAAHHGNWHHAGGWRCANSAAVIRPGGRVNCAPVCATYTPAFTCQRHAPSPAGCAG